MHIAAAIGSSAHLQNVFDLETSDVAGDNAGLALGQKWLQNNLVRFTSSHVLQPNNIYLFRRRFLFELGAISYPIPQPIVLDVKVP